MARKKKNINTTRIHLSPQFLARLSKSVQDYQSNPSDASALADIRKSRAQSAQFWENATTDQLETLYSSTPGKVQQLLLSSDIQNEPLHPDEEKYADQLCSHMKDQHQAPAAINHLMAAMLYRPADQLPENILQLTIPPWYMESFATYLLRAKRFFSQKGEIETWHQYMNRVVSFFYAAGSPEPAAANLFTRYANMISLYFGYSDLKDIMLKRARLAEAALANACATVDADMPGHTTSHDRIRLGILNAHYNPQTETYATLPVFEHLDRTRYEIILYGTDLRGHALERYCQSRADKLVALPKTLDSQVRAIRGDNLDLLFIGSNITAVNTAISQLATQRMAPVQVTSICSPVTTGFTNIDYYIAGDLTVSAEQDQDHYTERLITVPGSGLCFSYAAENTSSTVPPERKQMGIPEEAVLFVSGANFYKITPELREAWTKIIAEVPDSLLVLYPFNPYWSRSYPGGSLIMHMQRLFGEYSIDPQRLVILKPFPQRADIKALLSVCDVYLDAYPYGGATSIIDPLQTGLPPVVMEGEYLRFRQASAMLLELQMPGLITENEDDYRKLAVRLGKNPELREQLSHEITEKMESNPPFLNSRRYSAQTGMLFERLLKEPEAPH